MVKLVAAVVFLALAFWLFRLSMGLRWAKLSREDARAREEARGRTVVAEIPLPDEVVFLMEDAEGFAWGTSTVRKADVAAARLLLNGGIVGEFAEDGFRLPPPQPPEDYEGRERWDVVVFLRDGTSARIPCGQLREGVSREIAGRVFEAVKRTASKGRTSGSVQPA